MSSTQQPDTTTKSEEVKTSSNTNENESHQNDKNNNVDDDGEMTKSQKKKLLKLEKKKEMKEREKQKKKEKKAQQKNENKGSGSNKKKKVSTTEGITVTKEEDFGEWYLQTITKSGMLEYYDISGCYILRPHSYQIWERIQKFVDDEIKKMGVINCYFPMFVTKSALETEKDHIEGFAPEVAWVTKSGGSDLAEPVAIRPTSETIMYPAYSKWIRSHRDLPLQLNQWCNVVRWEFKNPVPFLRSREFLWQEGHSAFATQQEAETEVLQVLDIYSRTYEYLMAVPVIKGKKTEAEKFAGGHYTTTVEGFIPANGRAIQGATSHCLGQNFSKMFNIKFFDENKDHLYVWQNSWGITTRTIGVMTMVHSDDKGLVLPPRVAPKQVVLIPLYFKGKYSNDDLKDKVHELSKLLEKNGIRTIVDDNESKNPGWKFNEYELKGIPLRIELGPKDLDKNQVISIRRNDGKKEPIPIDNIVESVSSILENIQESLFESAKTKRDESIIKVNKWEDFVTNLEAKKLCLSPFCGEIKCEEDIKKKSAEESKYLAEVQSAKATHQTTEQAKGESLTGAAKSLCIPFDQEPLEKGTKCFACGSEAKFLTLFGRSY